MNMVESGQSASLIRGISETDSELELSVDTLMYP